MKKYQRGVTLLELIIAIGLLGGIMAGMASLINNVSDDTKASITALHIKTVGDAAGEYIKNNYAAVAANATATTPALIRVSDLIAGGALPSGYSVTNPRAQKTCVLVLEPTANNLTTMVVTELGDTIDDITLAQIAGTVGGAGGGIYSTATTTFRGVMGAWSLPFGNFANANHLAQKCDGTSGAITLAAGHPVMALWFADGLAVSATLYRDAVPGNTALNTMNTPILMGASTVQTVGNACTTNGAIGRDSNGGVVSCVSGQWKAAGGSQYWQDPVATYAALPACNAAAIDQTRVVETPTVGSGRRAYTCNGAGTWEPIGVDNNGNITVAGTATIGALTVSGNSTLNGNTTLGDASTDAITINGTSTINSGMTIGNGTAATSSNTLVVNRTATEGVACSPNGAVARDSNGLLLSCQSGSWQKAGGSAGRVLSSAVTSTFSSASGGGTVFRNGTVACGGSGSGYNAYSTSVTMNSGATSATVSSWFGALAFSRVGSSLDYQYSSNPSYRITLNTSGWTWTGSDTCIISGSGYWSS